jgi:hypothetical protein
MYGTLKISFRRHSFQSFSNRPEAAPAPGFSHRGFPWWRVWDCRIPDDGFPAIALSGGAFRALRPVAVPAVAYSSDVQSRLGYSPNGALEWAYHTTTGESRSKTNNSPDKKSRPFAAAPPSAHPASRGAAAARGRLRASTLARGWRDGRHKNFRHQLSYNSVNQNEA